MLGIGGAVSAGTPREGGDARCSGQQRDGDEILSKCKYILLRNDSAPVVSF